MPFSNVHVLYIVFDVHVLYIVYNTTSAASIQTSPFSETDSIIHVRITRYEIVRSQCIPV